MAEENPYIGDDGEVRDLDEHFFREAKRGRPPMHPDQRKKRVNLMLAPDVVAALDREKNKSEAVNEALRTYLGL
ncbi:hypothetical protein [Palleronia abyssalis]|uniref:Uncharacterized protein n=1 Tax=Palleronia abyssalis TaxID=1501240 RepID=A0A2R8BZ83_9RHOB|nr:hypothetical protein [Palleronia abyssalis]SPJ25454.1 hypothetical protein PAA8504_03305 [Palleronia abyssalis]